MAPMGPVAVDARRMLWQEWPVALLEPEILKSKGAVPKVEANEVRKAIVSLAAELAVAEAETAAGIAVAGTEAVENERGSCEHKMG